MRTAKRIVAVGLAVGLIGLATGCGRSSGGANGPDTGGSTSTANGDFGTLKGVCGKGDGKNASAPAGIKGVTPTQINLGVISDAGFPGRPGLDQELWDASDVFVSWCNSVGGINGRRLVGTHLDAALTQYKQKVLVACQSSFALVGGGGVFDSTGQKDRLKCLLPAFPGFLTETQARASTLQWQQLPTPLDQLNIGGEKWLTSQFPDSKAHVGFLTGNVASTITTAQQLQEAGASQGWTTVYNQQYNALGESTWVPFATDMKAKGVRGLMYVGEPENLGKLEQAMAAINYKPDWIWGGANIYDAAFTKAVGSQVINTYMPTSVTPFELAGNGTPYGGAVKQYLDLFKKYKPAGKVRALLAVDAFAAWLLFAKAAGACGANLTRKCLYTEAQKITSFDGGGLTAPANPAADQATPCVAMVKSTATGFALIDSLKPTNGIYNCDQGNVLKLTGSYGKGYTLADVGQSLANLK